jgi:hypothetical protein
MAIPDIPSRGIGVDTPGWPVVRLVDDVLAAYVDWREDAQAASDTYCRWARGPADEEPGRFSAYTAALDQEEASAVAYERSITELERWLPPQ